MIINDSRDVNETFSTVSPAPTSSECTEQPNESVETKDDKSKLVAGTESGKAVNKSNNNVTRSKNVPHTFLTMPDGKRLHSFFY